MAFLDKRRTYPRVLAHRKLPVAGKRISGELIPQLRFARWRRLSAQLFPHITLNYSRMASWLGLALSCIAIGFILLSWQTSRRQSDPFYTLTSAVTNDPFNAQPHLRLGQFFFDHNDSEQAKHEFLLAVRLVKNNPVAMVQLGKVASIERESEKIAKGTRYWEQVVQE